jgi:hypothetical protein
MGNAAFAWQWFANNASVASLDNGGNLIITGITSKPGGGSWNVLSDARLKDVAGKFERGLREVLALDPVRYHYKHDNALGLPSAEEYVGFIAQSVQKLIPEAVTKRPDGYLALNNDPILWAMVNALQEEHRRNEELQARVDRLERQMAGLLSASGVNQRHAHR